uniref:Uncharacterized protein n=1 Tax=viral metagenome TaxID=1070528 RepID=A0A6C0FBQ6_9ZZZZ|tara:strand:- start:3647 stop:3994 length:348 start_codon:yes stop_codon:yes gene_type:complete
MPYTGELIIDKITAKVEHCNINNQPTYATVDQVIALNPKEPLPPMQTPNGNLNSVVSSVDIMSEVYQALDALKIPTNQIKSSKAQGYTGQITHDSEYVYICVSSNNWKRIKLESF